MDDAAAVDDLVDRLLPERLRRLQRVSGVPVVFGGAIRPMAVGAKALVISRLDGTFGTSLRGLTVPSGAGLGGAVLRHRIAKRVENYASTRSITHHYDRVVVNEEKLTSVFAVPLILQGAVRGVLYGAVRGSEPIGDKALNAATTIARQLQRDLEAELHPKPHATPEGTWETALDDLAAIISATTDLDLLARLSRIHRELSGTPPTLSMSMAPLSPRELDTLRLAACGATNLEIAGELGLSTETIKAYLRSAMRKLGVHNRTAAVHAARACGVL